MAIEEAGYVIANLNVKTEGNLYAWDEENNRIVYIDKDGNAIYKNVDFNKEKVKIVVAGDTTLPGGFTATTDVTKPTTAKALEAALESGISVTLVKDIKIEMKEQVTIPSDVEVLLNLEDNATISLESTGSSNEGPKRAYALDNYGDLTITGDVIESHGIYNRSKATLTIKDSTIVATDSDGRAAINAQGGNVILDNVVLKAKTSNDTTDVTEMQSEPTCLKISNKGAVTATNCTIKAEISRPYAVQVYEDC